MAEHTSDEWTVAEVAIYGWSIFECSSIIATNLGEDIARQIAREHNAHEPLVAACETAVTRFDLLWDQVPADISAKKLAVAALKLAREEED